jgi:aminoglycoside phosphotransferase family enzyme
MSASTCHVPLDAELSFLSQPGSYPEPTRRVVPVETHMSWVFLTDDYAYKLKKPIRYGPIDARVTAMRHFYCVEEVRLNRRLADGIYLAALPLVLVHGGHLEFVGDGVTVDWLVKMRRLPHEQMLDDIIVRGCARPSDMETVAQLVAAFHRRCRKVLPRVQPFSERIADVIRRHERELLEPHYGLAPEIVYGLSGGQRKVLERLAPSIDQRHALGRVVEGHGDLRAEHVFLGEPTAVIDCIEFSRDLRTLDCLDEAGFLALECERLGAPALADAFLKSYGRYSGQETGCELRHFYQSVRAVTRATVAIRHLNDPRYRYSRHWRDRSLSYLALARRHLPH